MNNSLKLLDAVEHTALEWSVASLEYSSSELPHIRNLRVANAAAIKALRAELDQKMAPVQGYTAGIPWDMHLRAYDVYRKKYGEQQALIEGWCRGGFHVNELDLFIPGWREELSERTKLLQQLATVTEERNALLQTNISEFNLESHLNRQHEWSERTFGPGERTAGVIDHIRKELIEIEEAPNDLTEWIDVVILALDGAWRSGASPYQIISALVAKQTKNEQRIWPDWRTAPTDKAIQHVKEE